MQWFYELEGQKVGPVPPKTIRKLANQGVIQPHTTLWTDAGDKPIPARRVHDLFAEVKPELSPEIAQANRIMAVALDACRDDKEDLLDEHDPPITATHPFSNTHILLSYQIGATELLPPQPVNTLKTRGIGEKITRRTFKVNVETELCFRTTHRAKLSELRHSKPGHKQDSFAYRANEYEDGSWGIEGF